MRKLAVAVAVLAFLALIAGVHKDDTETLLLAAGALLCAYTTWRSSEISSFLKIFVGIFSTETIVFGVLNLIEVEGHWPAALQDYSLPETMALTVAVFSILVYLVSRSAIVQEMTRIADLYFDSDAASEMRVWPFPAFRASEPLIAVITIVVLVLFNQGIVGISVALTFIRRDYYNALQEMNAGVFWAKLLFGFTPLAFIYIATAVTEYVIKSYLILRWRRWLTKHYVDRWLGGHRHYAMALTGTAADNPDQRIAEDVNRFIDGGEEGYGIYSFTILLISTLSSVVSYSILLWSISAQLAFPIAKGVVLPGWLFWAALIYAIGGTLATHWIGRPLTGLMFERQRREADFRFSLARMREYGEQVALLSGETTERASAWKAVRRDCHELSRHHRLAKEARRLHRDISSIVGDISARHRRAFHVHRPDQVRRREADPRRLRGGRGRAEFHRQLLHLSSPIIDPCWTVSPLSTPPRSAPTSLCRDPRRNRPRNRISRWTSR